MAMMGTFVFLMRALRAPTPPRSPADIPSTSSMMMIVFLPHERLASVSLAYKQGVSTLRRRRERKDVRPPRTCRIPSNSCSPPSQRKQSTTRHQRSPREGRNGLTSKSFLLLVSLALSSMIVYPASFATRCAAVVLPMPGPPEMRTARYTPMMSGPGFLNPALYDLSLVRDDSVIALKARKVAWTHHASSHRESFSTDPLFPQISVSFVGAYLTVQSC
jgi:hypothetical protein